MIQIAVYHTIPIYAKEISVNKCKGCFLLHGIRESGILMEIIQEGESSIGREKAPAEKSNRPRRD